MDKETQHRISRLERLVCDRFKIDDLDALDKAATAEKQADQATIAAKQTLKDAQLAADAAQKALDELNPPPEEGTPV